MWKTKDKREGVKKICVQNGRERERKKKEKERERERKRERVTHTHTKAQRDIKRDKH